MSSSMELSQETLDETRADFRASFREARHHTNVWLSVLTIVIAVTSFAGPVVAAIFM